MHIFYEKNKNVKIEELKGNEEEKEGDSENKPFKYDKETSRGLLRNAKETLAGFEIQ
jgi:hypothetical protein